MPGFPLRYSQYPYPEHPLHDFLVKSAVRSPNKIAVIDDQRFMTFQQLNNVSNRFANGLKSIGINKGDIIAILAFNCIEYVIAFYAISKLGGIVTTLNPAYKEAEIKHQLEDSEAKVLIIQSQLFKNTSNTIINTGTVKHIISIGETDSSVPTFDQFIENHSPEFNSVSIDSKNDLIALPYSSGTTGMPKGVMLTHFNLVSNTIQFINVGGLAEPKEDDVFLTVLPLYHIYGMNMLMNGPIALGATIVLMPRFDLVKATDLIEKHQVTVLYIVPPIVLAFVNDPSIERANLSSVRFALSGAAPLSSELQSQFEKKTQIQCNKGYGLTETSPLTNGDYLESHLSKQGSIGPAVPDTEEMIVDLDTGINQLDSGQIGELIIRGPQVMKGYWNNVEATAETIRNGWLYTGDIAYMDKEGWVYIVDRKKEMIKFKGFQVAPAELEGVLLDHYSVSDVAVIGKPDPEAGEVPKAFVVL